MSPTLKQISPEKERKIRTGQRLFHRQYSGQLINRNNPPTANKIVTSAMDMGAGGGAICVRRQWQPVAMAMKKRERERGGFTHNRVLIKMAHYTILFFMFH